MPLSLASLACSLRGATRVDPLVMSTRLLALVAGIGAIPMPAVAVAPAAHEMPGNCNAMKQPLAFWFGHWNVYADGKLDGRSFIESTLDRCAVLEHWDDASGFKGMSLFYLEPHAQQWKQVWLTDRALAAGGTKEKTMLTRTDDAVRFQGSVWVAPDRAILDRTTLKKLPDGSVSQIIEISRDGGATWQKNYDAVYRRVAASDAR